MTTRAVRLAAAICAALGVFIAAPASAAPGDKQFYTLDSHNPQAFLRAARAGADFVKGGRGRQFRLVMVNAGVIIGIPGTSSIQKEVYDLKRKAPGLQIIACKETMDALQQANKRRLPVFPGVTVQSCKGFRKDFASGGWEPAIGLQ